MYIAFWGILDTFARCVAGLDGDGGRGREAAHWDHAVLAAGGRAVRRSNGLPLHRRAGDFRRIGLRPHGSLGRRTATAEVSSVVRSGLGYHARLHRFPSYRTQLGRSLRGGAWPLRVVLLVHVSVSYN